MDDTVGKLEPANFVASLYWEATRLNVLTVRKLQYYWNRKYVYKYIDSRRFYIR
jgi:hypothetical protein